MEVNIKHTDCFDCGVYLLNEERQEYAPFKHSSKVYLTQEENTSLKDEIMSIIQNSNDFYYLKLFISTTGQN